MKYLLFFLAVIIVIMLIIMSCAETEYERNYHTHWHKYQYSDWAYHADGHSHYIEEYSLDLHLSRYGGKDNKVVIPHHIWLYHGHIDDRLKYNEYLIWAEQHLD